MRSLMVFATFVLWALMCGRVVAAENRTIEIYGEGRVEVEPDMAHLKVGVMTTDEEAHTAAALNAQVIGEVLEAIAAAGVAERDMATSNYSINYERPRPDHGRLTGRYRVNNTVAIKVRDLLRVGEVLGAAIRGGANEAYGLSMAVEDPSSALVLARERAVANARQKAEQLAKLHGEKLGRVLEVSEVVAGGGGRPMLKAMAMDMERSVPIRAGSQQISVRLRVVYALQ